MMFCRKYPLTSLLRLVFSPIAVVILLFPAIFCSAAVINVPADQNTIQAAIDAASAGDTVLVANGTYSGVGNKNLDFKGKAITVRSVNGYQSTIIDCQNSGRGVFFHRGEKANSVFEGFTIKNGNATDDGGGIYITNLSSPTIRGCRIMNCHADRFGGGISIKNASPTLSDCIIENNTAPNSGGIHFWENAFAQVNSCVIRYNKALDYLNPGRGVGGGVGIYGSSPTLVDCTISGNESDRTGGGIAIQEVSSPLIDHCTIENNISKVTGGGVQIDNSAGTISNSTISGNILNDETRRPSGGGICLVNSQTAIVSCIIRANDSNSTFPNPEPNLGEVSNSGGISFRNGSNGLLKNSTITGNKAQERGGIGSWNSSPTISNCTIEDNHATAGGGGGVGLYTASGINRAVLSRSIVRNNTATKTGGGVAIWSGVITTAANSPTIVTTTISGNSAAETSGGINIFQSNATIRNSSIIGNVAPERAGVTVKNGSPLIINTLVSENVAQTGPGAGISCWDADAVITNCTIIKNTAATVGAALYSIDSEPVITNSILWGNIPAAVYSEGAFTPIVRYSAIEGWINGGEGNIAENPQFVDENDYHLSSLSPCIDAGDNAVANLPSYDFDGKIRVTDGNGDGSLIVDMGIDEFCLHPPCIPVSSGPQDLFWPLFLPAIYPRQ